MSSPVIQTAPLEVGRSSSQSALSERPGRWNGRVERGAESARKRDCSHGDCPPTLVGLRGGRLSLTANLSYEPPSPRDARPAHLGPSPSVHRPTRLTRPLAGAGSQASPPGRRASSERGAGARDLLSKPACRRMHGRSETFPAVGMAALPPLTPGGQAGGRSMTCLVARHARHADLSEPPLVDVCRWDHSSTPGGRRSPGSRRWRRRGRSRRRTGSRRSCGGRRSRRAAGRRNA